MEQRNKGAMPYDIIGVDPYDHDKTVSSKGAILYERRGDYNIERHHNALDLNFTYCGDDKYKLPPHWGDGEIVVDLSSTGKEQFQILKSVVMQLISMYKSLEYSVELLTNWDESH